MKRIKLHKKSIITGFILSMLMAIFCRSAFDMIVIYFLGFLSKLPIIGDLMKKTVADKMPGVKYTGSGTNIPDEYKNGYTSIAKEGMTADDLINAKNKGNNTGNNTGNSSTGDNVNYNEHWAIFQSWELGGGFQRIFQGEYDSNFKKTWIKDSVLSKKLLMGIYGAITMYAMRYAPTKKDVNKNSASENLNACKSILIDNVNFVAVYDSMHKTVMGIYTGFNLHTLKTLFKNANIDIDSSWLYKSKDLWRKNDVESVKAQKQTLLEWCSNTILKVNDLFLKDTGITLF